MKQILVMGAGKSSAALIDYLLQNAPEFRWHITVIDASVDNAKDKIGDSVYGSPASFQVEDREQRIYFIAKADIVISLLPPHLHHLVAEDCLALYKSLLTASYIDNKISCLTEEIKQKKLLFLCEMGLDPGIDHMSALQILHRVKAEGGKISSFKSHCGGLVAPESDDNPWHYKISWNPRNVVMAGKQGAVYRNNNSVVKLDYQQLFNNTHIVEIDGQAFSFYPNRDSLSYLPLYDMENTDTFIRTTLRHPDFIQGWKNIIELGLTDETVSYDTDEKSLSDFYKEHFTKNGFTKWLTAEAADTDKNKILFHQLSYLGLNDEDEYINKGFCSTADILQFALEKKLALKAADKDMVVMMHEIEYELNGKKYKIESSLTVKGEDSVHTAMAKTVGLPLGIAAMLILEGKITLTGLHIPILPEIYEPVLIELSKMGIQFDEVTKQIS